MRRSLSLDGARLKAPRGVEERRKEAKENFLESQENGGGKPQDGEEVLVAWDRISLVTFD